MRIHPTLFHHFATVLSLVAILTAAIVISAPATHAETSEWVSLGPDGGAIADVAVSPHNPNTVFAGTLTNGLFRSTDQGATWRPSSIGLPPSSQVANITFHPTDANLIYATLYRGNVGMIYKSTDAGVSWSNSYNGLSAAAVEGLAISPVNPSIMFAATNAPVTVFKSTNSGESWTRSGNGIIVSPNTMNNVVADPLDVNLVYAGAANGFYKSTNGGANWTRKPVKAISDSIFWLTAVRTQSGVALYASVGNQVYRSTDRGESWRSIGPASGGVSIRDGTIHPTNPNLIYVTGPEGVMKTENGGTNWTQVNSGIQNLGSIQPRIALDPSRPNQVFYAGSSLFRTTNGGTAWSASEKGLVASSINTITVDPKTPATIYAGSVEGIYKSDNGGSTWALQRSGQHDTTFVQTILLDPSRTSTVYVGTQKGAFKSTDGGGNWSNISGAIGNRTVNILALSPAAPETLYAGAQNGLFKSTNGAGSWTKLSASEVANLTVLALAIDPTTPNTVYVAGITLDRGVRVVLKSTNGGNSWTSINTGIGNNIVTGFVVDPAEPTTVYATVSGSGFFKSTDGGATWSASNTGMDSRTRTMLAIDSTTNPPTLYLGTQNGLYISTDRGVRWTAATRQGLTNSDLQTLSVNTAASPAQVFAATRGGGVFVLQPQSSSAPIIDLNGPAAGIDHAVLLDDFAQTAEPIAVVDTNQLIVSAPENTIRRATITLTQRPDGEQEQLDATVNGTSITKNYNAATGVLTLTGPASTADFQRVLRTVTYRNSSEEPDKRVRTITFVVNDGTSDSATATATLMQVGAQIYLPITLHNH